MRRDAADRFEPLGRPLFLEDVEPDPVHGHGVAAEKDPVVAGDLSSGHADGRDLGRLADVQDRLVLEAGLGQDLGDGLLAVVDVEADLVRGHAQGDVLRRPGDAAVFVVLEDGDVDELGDVFRYDVREVGSLLVLDHYAIELVGDLLGDPLDPLAVFVVHVEPADLLVVFFGFFVSLLDERPEPGDRVEDLPVRALFGEAAAHELAEFLEGPVLERDVNLPVVPRDPGHDAFPLGRTAHDPDPRRAAVDFEARPAEASVHAVPDDDVVFLHPRAFQAGDRLVDRGEGGGNPGGADAIDLDANDVIGGDERGPGVLEGPFAREFLQAGGESPVDGRGVVVEVDEHVLGGSGHDPAFPPGFRPAAAGDGAPEQGRAARENRRIPDELPARYHRNPSCPYSGCFRAGLSSKSWKS